MICKICGNAQPCRHTLRGAAVPTHTEEVHPSLDRESLSGGTTGMAAGKTVGPVESISLDDLAAQVRARSDHRNWREEVALRVTRHRARRRHTVDNGSMELKFPEGEASAIISAPANSQRPGVPPWMQETAVNAGQDSAKGHLRQAHLSKQGGQVAASSENEPARELTAARQKARKIIHFPNYTISAEPAAPRITAIELADPALEPPRTLEEERKEEGPKAEQMQLLPSFADIRLEETSNESQLAADLDLPLRPAALLQRLLAAVLDGAIMVLALAVFTFGFANMAPAPIPVRTGLMVMLGTGAILWLIFQYLFLVYGRATPGMRVAQLNLLAFDGRRVTRNARRTRALASALSVLSVGLGFAWTLVDEDTLGWHDRISKTYLKEQIAISK